MLTGAWTRRGPGGGWWGRAAAALAFVVNACGPGQPAEERDVPGGDPDRGKVLIQAFGCTACHMVPGLDVEEALVGPPLTDFAARRYIAGAVPNLAENLVIWIVDPQAVEPGTAMPDLGVSVEEARDMAAYLYTLGRPAPEPVDIEWRGEAP